MTESSWLAYFGQGRSRERPSRTCRLKEPTKGQRLGAKRVQSKGSRDSLGGLQGRGRACAGWRARRCKVTWTSGHTPVGGEDEHQSRVANVANEEGMGRDALNLGWRRQHGHGVLRLCVKSSLWTSMAFHSSIPMGLPPKLGPFPARSRGL